MIKNTIQLPELVILPHVYNEDTDQCLICMRMLINPVQCSKCKARFCGNCAKAWKNIKKMCPKKCSKGWKIKKTKGLSYKLKCPYECSIQLSPQEFYKHIKGCTRKVNDMKQQQLKEKFLCQQSHRLQYQSKITEIIKCPCGQISRSFCWICTSSEQTQQPVGYCCKCRPPPGMTKNHCPIGHNYKLADGTLFTGLITIYCDVCNKQIPHKQGCYNDRKCHFAVCFQCHDKLPQKAQILPADILSPMNQPSFVIIGMDFIDDTSPDYIPNQ